MSSYEVEGDKATIDELAQAVKGRTKKGILPAVPFVITLPLMFLCAMVAGVVPSLYIVLSTAKSSVDEMTSNIILTTTLSATLAFIQQLKQVSDTTTVFADMEEVSELMSTQMYNFGDNPKLNLLADKFRARSPGALSCIGRANLFGLATTTPPAGEQNSTYYQLVIPGRVCWTDYNSSMSLCSSFNRTTGVRFGPTSINPTFPKWGTLASTPISTLPQNGCPETGEWISFLSQAGILFFNFGTCPTMQLNKNGTYVCVTSFSPSRNFLSEITPAGLNRMFVITNENKIAFASVSVNLTDGNKSMVVIDKVSDPIIADIGAALLSHYGGGVSKMPYFNASQFKDTTANLINEFPIASDNGEIWATTAFRLRAGSKDNFALVVSLPKSQFSAAINQSQEHGMIIAALLASLGSIVGVVFTVLAVWPLKKIIKNMSKATKMDFSMLKDGKFDEGNVFIEIRSLQRTFNTMIKAFAGAIKANQKLQSATGGSSFARK
ncbi:hypothetical protein BJ742DRAFT_484956 [Cladochytrium replicatum]|nr:hypothetical protein BJ742DRAFT_484956 [Cladochytrium replicatum]